MTANLHKQYDDVMSFLSEYSKFSVTIQSRVLKRATRFMFRNFGKTLSELRNQRKNLLARRPSYFTDFIEKEADEAERKSLFFPIYSSEYPLDALSRELETRFPEADFDKLNQIHQKQLKSYSELGTQWKYIFAAIFGAGTLLLRSVPEPIVNQLGMEYATFQIGVFWITVSLIIFLALIILPTWFAVSGDAIKERLVSTTLEYTALRIKNDVR